MELVTAVKGRRSIRKYKQVDVPQNLIAEILDRGALVALVGKYSALGILCFNRRVPDQVQRNESEKTGRR